MALDITASVANIYLSMSLNKISANFWKLELKTEADSPSENLWVFQLDTTESVKNISCD